LSLKIFYPYLLVLAGSSIHAQTVEDLNPFDDVFDDMFGYLGEPLYIPESPPPDPPPAPLDGGLTALLLAGGAAGYRQYKKRKG